MDVLTLVLAWAGVAGAVYWLGTAKYKRAEGDGWLVWGVCGVVVWTAVQTRWFSVAPGRGVEYIFTNAAAGGMLLLGRELGWRYRRRVWVTVAPLLVVAVLEGALGLVQFFAMRAGAGPADSATGTYPNRNHFAGLLEMALPLAVAGAWAWRKTWWAAAGMLGVAGLLVMGTVVSLSRMGFMAALAGLFVMGMMLVGGRGKVLVGVGLVLAGAFLLLPTDEWIARFASIARTEDISGDTRAQIWRDTIPLIRDYWKTGVGMGAYEVAFYKYKNVAPMGTVDYAHNDYLQYLAELGVVGFGLGLSVIGRCFYWMTKGSGALVAGTWGAAAAMALHSLVDFNMYIPANVLMLAWILGLGAATALTEEGRAGSGSGGRW